LGRGFLNHKRVSPVKRAEFVSDRISYSVLRGHWFNIIVSNLQATSEEKSYGSIDRFFEELEQVLGKN
jgi:hypothetical protein